MSASPPGDSGKEPIEPAFVRRGAEDELPIVVVVQECDGAWTPGPCVSIEAGNAIELDAAEMQWLIEDAGPKALKALRGLAT